MPGFVKAKGEEESLLLLNHNRAFIKGQLGGGGGCSTQFCQGKGCWREESSLGVTVGCALGPGIGDAAVEAEMAAGA